MDYGVSINSWTILSRRSGLLEELNKFLERKVQKLTQSNESPAMWIKIDDRQAIFAIISSYADSQKKRILDAIKEKP